MSRRDWWFGVLAIVVALLVYAAFPRYEWRDPGGDNRTLGRAYIRVDRWTGRAEWGTFGMEGWASLRERRAWAEPLR